MITFLRNYLLQYLYKSIDAHIEQFIKKLMIDFADIYTTFINTKESASAIPCSCTVTIYTTYLNLKCTRLMYV